MNPALNDHSLDLIFRSARTPNGWADRPVEDDLVRETYDLMKWGPTSANSSPARFVWVRSADGKATLAGLAAEQNKPKILAACHGHHRPRSGLRRQAAETHASRCRGHAEVLCGTRRGRGDGNAKRNAAGCLPHSRRAGVGTGLRSHVRLRQRRRGQGLFLRHANSVELHLQHWLRRSSFRVSAQPSTWF
jgi:hypothetical protein